MWSLRQEGNDYVQTLYSTLVPGGPRTFGEDVNGELYVATGSTIYRIEDPTPPVSGCPDEPADDCDEPDQASLIVRDRLSMGPSLKDRLSFNYVKGPATSQGDFGMPTQNTDYLFCLYAGDNPERISTESKWAMLCGIAPIPVSTGMRDGRFRLNSGGDRDANNAIWRIVITRLGQREPRTIAYMQRRLAEGKSKRDIVRCLKRYVAREVFHALPR